MDLTTLTREIYSNYLQARTLRSAVADLDLSTIHATRELQAVCSSIVTFGTVDRVSCLFYPPSLVETLAKIDVDALAAMEKALPGASVTEALADDILLAVLKGGTFSTSLGETSLAPPLESVQDEMAKDKLAMSEASWVPSLV